MRTNSPRWQPTWRDALWAVAFAAALIGFRWWEHGWVLKRGDYPGAGPHTWYWTWKWTFPIALALLFAAIRWGSGRRKSR